MIKENSIKDQISTEEKIKVETAVEDGNKWLNVNQYAETETYKNKTKEIEDLWNPIITKFFGAGGFPGGANRAEGGVDEVD